MDFTNRGPRLIERQGCQKLAQLTLTQRLISGVDLDDGFVQVSSARAHGNRTEVVIHEGRNQIVRRLFDEVEFPVLRLIRTSIGSIKLGELPEGRWRSLNNVEVSSL